MTDQRTGTADIWIYDVSRGAPIRFTSDLDNESWPVWSPDGRRILFRMNRGGPESLRMGSAAPNLYAKTLGTGEEELLVADPSPLAPEDWSSDGKWIAYNNRNTDLLMLSLAGDRKSRPFRATRFLESDAKFSPDSTHIAFVTTESGPPDVYVTTVGESGETKRISIGGGTSPRWRRDGRELFYASADRRSIMTVPIDLSPTFKAGIPKRLFTIGAEAATLVGRTTVYDVTPNGERFLVNVPAGEPESSRITVVLNWPATLKVSPSP